MLNFFNTLRPFIENSYLEIGVREYARLMKLSPPTASTTLEEFRAEGILVSRKYKRYKLYQANRNSRLLIDIGRAFWRAKLEKIGFVDHIAQTCINPVMVLFGSASKAELKPDSDLDIAIFSASKTKVNAGVFEAKLNRPIQIFVYADMKSVTNKQLLNNMLNGYMMLGEW